ncbi:MAG: PGPGW domain-containing protein [Thermodesulfovibrionia bacterium]
MKQAEFHEEKKLSRSMGKKPPKITTLQQAKKVVRVVVGFTILLFGFVLLFLPGPGVLIIVLGLALLGTEFVWARKLMKRFKKQAHNVKNSFFNNSRKTDNK